THSANNSRPASTRSSLAISLALPRRGPKPKLSVVTSPRGRSSAKACSIRLRFTFFQEFVEFPLNNLCGEIWNDLPHHGFNHFGALFPDNFFELFDAKLGHYGCRRLGWRLGSGFSQRSGRRRQFVRDGDLECFALGAFFVFLDGEGLFIFQ